MQRNSWRNFEHVLDVGILRVLPLCRIVQVYLRSRDPFLTPLPFASKRTLLHLLSSINCHSGKKPW